MKSLDTLCDNNEASVAPNPGMHWGNNKAKIPHLDTVGYRATTPNPNTHTSRYTGL